jgi:hypothetical protein
MDVDEGPASANLATPFISGANDCYFRWVSKADSLLKQSSHSYQLKQMTVAPIARHSFLHCSNTVLITRLYARLAIQCGVTCRVMWFVFGQDGC